MSVTTGSFGTADAPASSPSLHGLDGVNFFLAAALAGFGPYVPAYLADQKWTQTDIGLVLTVGSIAGLLSQLPGSEVLDKVRSKRAVIAVGASIVILSAVIVAFWPRLPSVFIALVLQGAIGGFLGPAIAAISLGLVGHGTSRATRPTFRLYRSPGRRRAHRPCRLSSVVSGDIPNRRLARTSVVFRSSADSCSRYPLRPILRSARSPWYRTTAQSRVFLFQLANASKRGLCQTLCGTPRGVRGTYVCVGTRL
jgi:hypothetical protein